MSGSVRLASLILLLVSFGGGSLGHILRLPNSEDGRKGPILELHLRVGLEGGSSNITSNSDQFRTIDIAGEQMEEKNQEIKRLGAVIQHLLTHCKSSSDEVMNNNSNICPSPDATCVPFPPRCCSFPFTLDGQLHYQCVPRNNEPAGCFIANRTWVTCAEPASSEDRNATGNVRILTTLLVDDWVVLQQRIDISERGPFEQSAWEEFKHGFGQPGESFWLGLEQVHRQTNRAPYKLRIEFKLMNGSWYSAEYDTFRVESESEQYRIHVGGYSGDFGDIMNDKTHNSYRPGRGVINGMKFSTTDRQNDLYGGSEAPCAIKYGGGWWFNYCFNFNPNGFKTSDSSSVYYRGEFLNLSASRMMMKRK